MHISCGAVSLPVSLLRDPVSLISWKARVAVESLSRALAPSLRLRVLGLWDTVRVLDFSGSVFQSLEQGRGGWVVPTEVV